MIQYNSFFNKAALAIAAIAFTACDDFVDIKTQGSIVPNKIDNFRYLLNNTSEWLYGSALPDVMSDDISVIDGSNQYNSAVNGGDYYAWFWKAYIWSSQIYPVDGYYNKDDGWNAMYNTSTYANVLINEIGNCTDGTQAEKDQLAAEAKVHRADAYLMLVNQYAKPYNKETAGTDPGVPLVTSEDTEQSLKRASVQAVYDQIIKDLTEALPYLPSTQDYTTKPTKASAYGELARAYLLMGDYENAYAAADNALQEQSTLNDMSLMTESPVSASFYPQMINDPEVLLLKTPTQSNGTWDCTMLHLSDEILNLLGEKDKRYQLFTASVADYASSFADAGGRLFYQDISMSYRNIGPSVPEMMLIKAEYYARNNQPAEAMRLVNDLRKTRFAAEDYEELTANTADDALKAVIDERHREFFCRNLRWYDMRRLKDDARFAKTYTRQWGGQTYTLTPESNRYVLPIPAYQIVLNPEIEQNPE